MNSSLSRVLILMLAMAAPVHETSAEMYEVFILTGQSNSLGTTRYGGDSPSDYGPGFNKADQQVSFFWSNVHASNTQYPPKLYGDSGGKFVSLRMQQGDGVKNPAFWGPEFGFARTVLHHTKNKVLIIKASRGGGGNSYWDKAIFEKDHNAGHMWKHLCNTVDVALKTVADHGDSFVVKGLLYIQGESNSVREAEISGKRLEALYKSLDSHIDQAYPGSTSDMKVLVAEIASSQHSPARKQTALKQSQLARSQKVFKYVSTRDLPLQPDHIHFGKKAKLEIGRRMANAYIGTK